MEPFKDGLYYFRGYKKDFEEIQFSGEECLHKGDLVIRKMKKMRFYHSGIYCGNKVVIEFTEGPEVPQKSSVLSSASSQSVDGLVHKINLKTFKDGKKLRVFRLRNGVPATLEQNIQTAMEHNFRYNFTKFNCWHFALGILELRALPLSSSEDGAVGEDETEMEGLCSSTMRALPPSRPEDGADLEAEMEELYFNMESA